MLNRISSRLSLETLEARTVPTAHILVNGQTHEVHIVGTGLDDTTRVVHQGGRIAIHFDDAANHEAVSLAPSQVKSVVFNGGAGNDVFRNSTEIQSEAFGDSGNDTLVGGSGIDILDGGDGDDSLHDAGGRNVM